MPLNSLGSILLLHFFLFDFFFLLLSMPLTPLDAIVGTAYVQVESEFI